MPYKSQWPANTRLPKRAARFEDMAFLFTCSNDNRGIIRMNFDEAAALWSLTAAAGGAVVEVGRAEGGSTILMAAALRGRGTLFSIDNDPVDDQHLRQVLAKLGLLGHTRLIVDDSQMMNPVSAVPVPVSLVFIDGDHTYEGVKADFENWFPVIEKGGMVVFHDVTTSGLENYGPEKLWRELEEDSRLIQMPEKPGSIRFARKV